MDIIHYYYLFCFARLHNRHYHRAYVRLYAMRHADIIHFNNEYKNEQ